MKSRTLQFCCCAVAALSIFLAGRVSSDLFRFGPVSVPAAAGPQPRSTVLAPLYPAAAPASRADRGRAPAAPKPSAPAATPFVPSGPSATSNPQLASEPPAGGPPANRPAGESPQQPQSVFVPVADPSCSDCRITQSSGGTLRAEIPGTNASQDSAYARLDFGGQSSAQTPVYLDDRISLGLGDVPASDLQVLQVTDSANRVVYRVLVAAGTRDLRIESPPGGLSVDPVDVDTGVVVPNDGTSIGIHIAAQAGSLLVVDVDGREVARRTDLRAGSTGPQRYLSAGIVAAAPGAGSTTPLSVSHAALAITAKPAAPTAAPAPTPTLASTPPVRVLAPSASEPPTISGTAVEGQALAATAGTWSDATAALAVTWERCSADGTTCTSVGSGTSFTPGAAGIGSRLRVVVTATNSAGSGTAYSALTAPVAPAAPPVAAPVAQTAPTISGAAAVGSTLTADPGTWSDADGFTYAWQRCDATGACAAIDGATGSTYVLTQSDAGVTLVVVVAATGPGGTTTVSSAATAVVVAPPVSTAPPAISGDAVVGGTLTASAGAWSDPAATITYSWQRCDASGACAPIDGATGPTLTLGDADAGATISVVVTATNAAGSSSASSAAVTVAAPAPPPPPAPTPTPETPAPAPTPPPTDATPPPGGDATPPAPAPTPETPAPPVAPAGDSATTDAGVPTSP